MTHPSTSPTPPSGTPCEGSIPVACSQAFREIAAQGARLSEGQEALGAKLDAVSKAVLGNGTTKDSLLARMNRLESSAETVQRCGDRFWKVFGILTAVAAVVVAICK